MVILEMELCKEHVWRGTFALRWEHAYAKKEMGALEIVQMQGPVRYRDSYVP